MNRSTRVPGIGEAAPDFDVGGGQRASDLWAERHLVLFFFPKAFTPG